MKRRFRWIACGALVALLGALGCVLTAKGFQALVLDFELSEALAAGAAREVHTSFYPHPVQMKGFFLRASGNLKPAGNAALPSQVKVMVVNADADSGRVSFKFNLTVKVDSDGNFSASKKWKKNVEANTLQSVAVQVVGADVPAGSRVWLCLDAAKKKNDFGPSCEMEDGGPGNGLHEVRILDNRFDPKSLLIQPGDTVRWVFRGSDQTHTTTEMNGTWDSGFVFVQEGNFFERTFPVSEDGQTFMYSCVTHQGCCEMQGSILVGASAEPPDDGY